MSITRAELISRALEEINAVGRGVSPSATDSTFVGNKVDAAHAELETDGVAYWETSAIPDDVSDAMVLYIAAMIGPAYGKFDHETGERRKKQARAMLDRLTATPSAGKPVKAVYY